MSQFTEPVDDGKDDNVSVRAGQPGDKIQGYMRPRQAGAGGLTYQSPMSPLQQHIGQGVCSLGASPELSG